MSRLKQFSSRIMQNLETRLDFGLSLKGKIALIAIIPCVMLIISSLLNGLSIVQLADKVEFSAKVQLSGVELVSEMTTSLISASNSLNVSFINVNDDAERAGALQAAKGSVNRFNQATEDFTNLKKDEKTTKAFTEILTKWTETKKLLTGAFELIDIPSPDNIKAADETIKKKLRPAIAEMTSLLENIRDDYQAQSKKFISAAEALEKRSMWLALIIGSLGVALCIFAGLVTGKSILNKLGQAIESLELIGTSIGESSNKSLHSSRELSDAANAQNSSLQQSSSALEELRSMIERNTSNAKETSSISQKSKQTALDGKTQIEDLVRVVDSFDEVTREALNHVDNGNKRLVEIQEVINSIGEKTKVINEIVFQTKLLSFNASVEAARAGEHGRGFSVVAEEVGNLAKMSGNSALEITGLLEQSMEKVNSIITESRSNMVSLVKQCDSQTNQSKVVSSSCRKILDQLVEVVTHAATSTQEILANNQRLLTKLFRPCLHLKKG